MKLFKFALLALTLLATITLAGSNHHTSNTAGIALAMEPASWVFVAFGLAGGGFLHNRRPRGLNLTAVPASTSPAPSKTPAAISRRASLFLILKSRPLKSTARDTAQVTQIPAITERLTPKVRAVVAAALCLVFLTATASADSIYLASSPASSITLFPSNDTVSIKGGSVTTDSNAGTSTMETGDLTIGNSNSPNHEIPFSFQDALALNGITESLTFNGKDDVTGAADTLTLYGGPTVAFGDELLSLQDFPVIGNRLNAFPLAIAATVKSAPEPGSLLLLGTGIVAGALVLAKKGAVKKT